MDRCRRRTSDEGVLLRLIGIDILADDIYRKYQILAKEHLGLTVDTEQIQTPEDFVKHYDSNELAAPLSTSFQFRENELQRLSQAFEESDIVILSGKAGTGKTRLALEFAERYKQKHGATVYVIHNHGLGIFDDLKQYFELPGDYFVIVDDANQISELSLIIEYVNKKSERYNVKILVTVRSYALQKVKSDIIGIARFKEIKIGIFSDEKIKTLIKAVYGIQNEQFLNRIARISEGNARIAVLAGKIAIEANSLSSINDVTDLYSAYYGKAFSTAGMDGN